MMVLKRKHMATLAKGKFENGVIYDGTQTNFIVTMPSSMFENGVIYDGTQTRVK